MDEARPGRTAARVLVDQLVANGVRHVFTVPGESFLPVLDALRDSGIAVTTCRQEGAAAMMAEAHGKATGMPGICFVTRGPGATNASAGLHVAQQDSTPMILFVGQIERRFREREAFQELDYRAVFGPMAKWATEIDDPDRVPEFVARAFATATAGRPGPVVVALPKDMLSEATAAPLAPPFRPVEAAPGEEDVARLADLVASAERPLLLLGGSRWSEGACAAIARFAEAFDLPVATSYRRSPLFDALHPNYAGDLGLAPNPKLVARARAADLLVLLGGRLGEIPSQGYSLLDVPGPRTRLVHIHAGPEELGRVYQPFLAINASPARTAAALARLPAPARIPWREETRAAHAEFLAWGERATPQPGGVNLGEVIIHLREVLPRDAVLCNGAGNYAAWIHRFYRFRGLASHIAPTSASMGYGVPAAVAMKRLWPQRTVVSINGDGDFLMNGQEFATAVQYRLPLVVIVADNASYGTIRMHQEREFPDRVVATDLVNPDFAAYARAFGGLGWTVERTEDFPAAFREASACGRPAIIHLKIATDAITPGQTLTQIRDRAVAGRAA
ncbi:thiamine pyrophosphate protein TPP binding domain protein [Methylobacterium sp. 4-46]|uniref:thiamine pyrophosphate-binding protein n=1 Tax=unclassified Methylobacterium TaxID=2615210 RepID=UPI000152C777|nr:MULTISPECIES: thiamine pyrophosphate-binding protein [Methylobacterium]ACA20779.1 thiamine pyrophosphate protein TPP binding domain protein [Methylobacterium sp. 4-46]WFT79933.1 thiamine pyrophosphate-binding protein [Methylobacterium nodulans]